MNIANIHEGRIPAQLLFVFRQIERLAQGYTLATKPPIAPDYFGEACAECKGHGKVFYTKENGKHWPHCKACDGTGWQK